MNSDEQNKLLETLAAIFIRSFFLSLGLIYLWFGFYLITGSSGYSIHSKWFNLNRYDYELVNYFGIAFTKISAILFFLVPYLSIKWVLRTKKRNT
jgi:hypothetical protein